MLLWETCIQGSGLCLAQVAGAECVREAELKNWGSGEATFLLLNFHQVSRPG